MTDRRQAVCMEMRTAYNVDVDKYMDYLFENQADLGADFVVRQVEWAENILQDRLAGALPGAKRPAAPVNSLPHGEAGGSGSTESIARIRAHWE
ncbi:hypothetical protein [Collimonas sp. OK607]|uniref:hypothetical protein n=1 Tax=Collimonas sp. OK607 TaxID=1798194 RepID=UPI001113566C|nr:hypothetical protein [Collimonas sp. OK607]